MEVDSHAVLRQIEEEAPQEWAALETARVEMRKWVAEADERGEMPTGFLTDATARTLNRLNLPTEHGGLACSASAIRRAVTFERFGAECPAIPIGFPGPGLSMPPIKALGLDDQIASFCSHFHADDRPVWGAFAITEAQGGSDATAMRTRAVAVDGGYRLSGSKCFITNGARAQVLVVFATVAPEKGRFGIRAFVLPSSTAGFQVDRREDMMGLRASQLATLSFTDCFVESTQMLGHDGQRGPRVDAFTGAQFAWDYMRPVLASVINGACFGVLQYARDRIGGSASELPMRRLDEALATLQELHAVVVSSRLLTLRAAWNYDNGAPSARVDASLAKAYASSAARRIAHTLRSLLPLEASLVSNPVAKFYRDAKAFDILEGTGDMQRLMVARGYERCA